MGGIHRKTGGEGDAARRPVTGRPSIENSINHSFPIGWCFRVSFHDRKVIPGKIRIER